MANNGGANKARPVSSDTATTSVAPAPDPPCSSGTSRPGSPRRTAISAPEVAVEPRLRIAQADHRLGCVLLQEATDGTAELLLLGIVQKSHGLVGLVTGLFPGSEYSYTSNLSETRS